MAIVRGTNAGFVTAAPSSDPGGIAQNFDNDALAFRDDLPAGSWKVTEIGWYQSRASGASAISYECAIYSDDASGGAGNEVPNAIIDSKATGSSTDGSEQWWNYTGLDITSVSGGSWYWVAFGIGDVAANNNFDMSGSGAHRYSRDDDHGTLQDPWGETSSDTRMIATYAKYEAVSTITSILALYRHYQRQRI